MNANQTKYRVSKLEINGPNTLAPRVIYEERGFFVESNTKDKSERMGIRDKFVQDNHSLKNTLYGLHFQRKS